MTEEIRDRALPAGLTEGIPGGWKNSRMILMEHGGERMILWVNPEEIRVERSMLHRTVETAAGEVLQRGGPGLARVTLETWLPGDGSRWRAQGSTLERELRLLRKWCEEGARTAVQIGQTPAADYHILSLAEILREGDDGVGVAIELAQARTEEDLAAPLPGGGTGEGPDPSEPDDPGTGEAEDIPAVYTVVRGDNLSRIARRLYGDSSRWRDIYNANRDRIDDPNLIYPGQRLVIP